MKLLEIQCLSSLFCVILRRGGRASEVLSLEKKHFDFKTSKYSIIVKDMMVLKKYQLERDDITGKSIAGTSQRIPTFRTFPILKDEELSDELTYLIDNNHKGLLFHYPYKRNLPLTRQLCLWRVKEIADKCDVRLTQHWFRGQRTGQLKIDYRLMGDPLNEWIGWSGASKREFERQVDYAKMGWQGLEQEMLIGRKQIKEAYE